MIEGVSLILTFCGGYLVGLLAFAFAAKSRKPAFTAAIGLTLTFFNITTLALNFTICEVVGIRCSNLFGKSDFGGMKRVMNHGYFVQIVLLLSFSLPVFYFSDFILSSFGVDKEVASLVKMMLLALFPASVLQVMTDIFKTFCQSQNIITVFGPFQIFCILVYTIVAWYSMVFKEKYILGFILSKSIFEFLDLLLCIYLHFFQIKAETKKPISRVLVGFTDFVWSVCSTIGTFYIGYFAMELNTLLLGFTRDNDQITCYTSIINFAGLIYSGAIGVAAYGRAKVNALIGAKEYQKARNLFNLVIFIFVVLGFIASFTLYLSRKFIAQFYGANENSIQLVQKALFVYSFGIFFDSWSPIVLTLVRTFEMNIGYIITQFLYFFFFNLLGGYYLCYNLGYGALGFVSTFFFSTSLQAITNVLFVEMFGWEKLDEQMSERERLIEDVYENN